MEDAILTALATRPAAVAQGAARGLVAQALLVTEICRIVGSLGVTTTASRWRGSKPAMILGHRARGC